MTRWNTVAAATILAALWMTLTGTSFAQEAKSSIRHLNKPNPDELNCVVIVEDDCGSTESQITNIVEGEILRARTTPILGWAYDSLVIIVTVDCLNAERTGAYNIQVRFGRILAVEDPAPDERDYLQVLYGRNYGGFGFAGLNEVDDDIADMVQRAVSSALTDYLKANSTSENY